MEKLLTAENIKSIAIAAVVLLSGGNLYQGKVNENDVNAAVGEIHELHSQLSDTINRQKDMQKSIHALLEKSGTPNEQ